MPKGTSQAEMTSNSKPVALTIIALHLPEEVSQSVSQKFHIF